MLKAIIEHVLALSYDCSNLAFKVDQPLNFSDLKPHRCDVSVLTNSAKFNAVQLLFSN